MIVLESAAWPPAAYKELPPYLLAPKTRSKNGTTDKQVYETQAIMANHVFSRLLEKSIKHRHLRIL